MRYREESDFLGKVRVPHDAYYGSFTQRAIENFPVSGHRLQADFIRAYATIKKAAAAANLKAGALDQRLAKAISSACDQVISGKMDSQFMVDVYQAGAGTATNMNLNEVIANLAEESLGGKKGHYKRVHPNDHVNMSQSTNDTFHTAMHVSAYIATKGKLIPALEKLHASLERKSSEFARVIKLGRTHLQDAVPMSLGQEFSGYAYAIDVCIDRLQVAMREIEYLPIGGTAIGTGINAAKGYRDLVIGEINSITKQKFKLSNNIFFEMQDQASEAFVSSALHNAAMTIGRISNDLRLLSSGPRGGIGELTLPEVEPGSSIMPGKVNPSILEMVNMVCFTVAGNDATISAAASAGQLELNVFMPVVAYKLLGSINILANAASIMDSKCVRGIKANEKPIAERLKNDLSLATALSPYIGYEKAAHVARKAYREGKSVEQVCLEMKLFKKEELSRILDSKRLAGL
ncbi:MAG: aspartate ammonia-lyase [Candidatus Micrarchaeota archaeon]|nr:aspartate ammonia-lyase [Candidatus Micrarchaeota archaeon]